MKRHLLAYINHMALNLGSALACIWHAFVPPQWTGHSSETIDRLAGSNPARKFLEGLA